MPRNPTTGVFTRVNNSFSEPVYGTPIDPADADQLFDDYDAAFTNSVPKEPSTGSGSSIVVAAGTAAIAIQRVAPTATGIQLPSVTAQDGIPLHIIDWSTGIAADHVITITPDGAETIMQDPTWPVYSTATQLGSVTLYPSTTLNGWYIAP